MYFHEYATAVESLPWPSNDADGTAKAALERLTRPGGSSTKEEAVYDLSMLLWYVATAARENGIALTSVADKSLAVLSKLPPNMCGMAR